MQQKAVFTHYLSFGPATSRPSRPSIGSAGRLFPPSFDCCAADRSSSFTACSARYPSYINASVEGKMRRAFALHQAWVTYLFPNRSLAPKPSSFVCFPFRFRHRHLQNPPVELTLVHIVHSFFRVACFF